MRRTIPEGDSPLHARAGTAERALLGALLVNNDTFDRIAPVRIGASHFGAHGNALIFSAIASLICRGQLADVITVHDLLCERNEAPRAGGLPYLNSLAAECASATNAIRYAEIVVEQALLRQLIFVTSEIQASVSEPAGRNVHQLLDHAQKLIGGLGEQTVKRDAVPIAAAAARFIEQLDQRISGGIARDVVSTGLTDLDKALHGGLLPGRLYVLGGRPAMGKSALAGTVGSHLAAEQVPTAYLSQEMPEEELTGRTLAQWSDISIDALQADNPEAVQSDFWARLVTAGQLAATATLFIDETSGLTLLDVASKARTLKRKSGLRVLIVDYLQLMVGTEEKRHSQIETITRGLKSLAKELGISILLLSQLNREIDRRTNKRPLLADFKDSGSIEADADVVMGIYRPEQDDPDTPYPGCAELHILKHRGGKLAKVLLAYKGMATKFHDYHGAPPLDSAVESRGQRAPKGFDRLPHRHADT